MADLGNGGVNHLHHSLACLLCYTWALGSIGMFHAICVSHHGLCVYCVVNLKAVSRLQTGQATVVKPRYMHHLSGSNLSDATVCTTLDTLQPYYVVCADLETASFPTQNHYDATHQQ